MSTTLRITGYSVRDVARGRWISAYAALLLTLAVALSWLEGDVVRATAGLVNVTLLVVPLVALLFGTLYVYGTRSFNRLLLAQPIDRRSLFRGLYLGVAIPLVVATLVGLGGPLASTALIRGEGLAAVGTLLAAAIGLTLICLSLAFLVGVTVRDRAAGMGVAILLWLLLTLVYDGVLVAASLALPNIALERPALAVTLLNPIDTARIALVMQFDGAALMGYTGAVFRAFFGGAGLAVAAAGMVAWAIVPWVVAERRFRGADL